VVWNEAAEAITGYPAAQVIGKTAAAAFPPGFGLFDPDEDARLHRQLRVADADRPLLRTDGTVRELHIMAVPLFDGNGATEYVLCIAEDITLRRAQERQLRENAAALRESAARLRTVADTVPAMVAYVDADQVYRFHNTAYEREFGGRTAIDGRTIRDIVGPARHQRLLPYIERVLAGETVVFEETEDHDGKERTLEVTYIPQRAGDGHGTAGFHVMRQDITVQKREKMHLLRLAQVDALTGMINRAGFLQKLDEAMALAAESGQLMALLYLDIDRFKPVNDTYGHSVGDALLKAFSGRLAHSVRATDTIARLGGDEFTIIMENLARPEDASTIASKIVANMRGQFILDGLKVSISTSIGLAFYNGGEGSAPALIEQADMMLYKAKEAGRDTYRAAA
jgi:diguanylate cyclase (GGDEF)-like protein/PAS domain S-box-containing protein